MRNQKRIMSPALWVLAGLVGLVNLFIWHNHQQTDDWSALWVAGLIAHGGDSDSLYQILPEDFARWYGPVWEHYSRLVDGAAPHPFIHIPIVAYFLGALSTFMSYPFSVGLLTFLQGASLLLLVAGSYFLWMHKTLPTRYALPAVFATWLTPAAQMSAHIGQTTPLIFAALVCGLAIARERPILAGALLGIAGAIKLTPLALVVPLLLYSRTRRTAAWMTGWAAAMFGSSLIGGTGVFAEWVRTLRWINSAAIVDKVNQGFSAVILLRSRNYDGEFFAPIDTNVPLWVAWTPRLIGLLLIIALMWAAWLKPRYGFETLSIGFLAVATLTSNILWDHYLLLAVPVLLGIYAMTKPRFTPIQQWLLVAAALATAILYPPGSRTIGYSQTGLIISYAGLLGLFLLTLIFIAASYTATQVPEPKPLNPARKRHVNPSTQPPLPVRRQHTTPVWADRPRRPTQQGRHRLR